MSHNYFLLSEKLSNYTAELLLTLTPIIDQSITSPFHMFTLIFLVILHILVCAWEVGEHRVALWVMRSVTALKKIVSDLKKKIVSDLKKKKVSDPT